MDLFLKKRKTSLQEGKKYNLLFFCTCYFDIVIINLLCVENKKSRKKKMELVPVALLWAYRNRNELTTAVSFVNSVGTLGKWGYRASKWASNKRQQLRRDDSIVYSSSLPSLSSTDIYFEDDDEDDDRQQGRNKNDDDDNDEKEKDDDYDDEQMAEERGSALHHNNNKRVYANRQHRSQSLPSEDILNVATHQLAGSVVLVNKKNENDDDDIVIVDHPFKPPRSSSSVRWIPNRNHYNNNKHNHNHIRQNDNIPRHDQHNCIPQYDQQHQQEHHSLNGQLNNSDTPELEDTEKHQTKNDPNFAVNYDLFFE